MHPQPAHAHSALLHLLNVVLYRAIAELRAEATRTYAGYLWWLIQPLLMFAVYFVAFNTILGDRREDFAVFLFTGIMIWQWFAVTVQRCAGSLIASQSLMQQVNLHKSVFPFSIMLVNTIKFMVTLLILMLLLSFVGHPPGFNWFYLPLVLLIEFIVIAGFGCFSAMITPFVPDFQHMLVTILHLAFFVSGVIYELDMLPDRYSAVLGLNPMSVVIEQSRRVLMDNLAPDFTSLLLPLLIGTALLAISLGLIHRFDKVYPKIG